MKVIKTPIDFEKESKDIINYIKECIDKDPFSYSFIGAVDEDTIKRIDIGIRGNHNATPYTMYIYIKLTDNGESIRLSSAYEMPFWLKRIFYEYPSTKTDRAIIFDSRLVDDSADNLYISRFNDAKRFVDLCFISRLVITDIASDLTVLIKQFGDD